MAFNVLLPAPMYPKEMGTQIRSQKWSEYQAAVIYYRLEDWLVLVELLRHSHILRAYPWQQKGHGSLRLPLFSFLRQRFLPLKQSQRLFSIPATEHRSLLSPP